jgi:hypothetical protein
MTEESGKLFIDLCVEGAASPGDISLHIREWRDKDCFEPLEDYLGLTTEELDAYLDDPKALPDIIDARKLSVTLDEYRERKKDEKD